MSDLHDLLEREAAGYAPPPDLLKRVRDRGHRRERNRRVGTTLGALLVVAVSIVSLPRVLPREAIVFEQSPDPWAGAWVSVDTDGSSQTMAIRGVDGGQYQIVVDDDSATVCSGGSSTMTGMGRLEAADLVIAAPMLTCDDGSTPAPVEGSSVDAALRNYTLIHDVETATLTDSFGVRWGRQHESADGPEPTTSDGMWPQSSMDEVREAQERANAGDPDFTWQVAPDIYNDAAPPGDAAIFRRYLQQELGWESARWGDQVELVWTADCAGGNAGPGCTSHEIGFVRCAPRQPNPLYPKDGSHGNVPDEADGTTCAPTVDDTTYETITLVARQPGVKGPNGIWVITDSYPAAVFRQTAPLSEATVVDAIEEMLQARLDGEGAEEHVVASSDDIPLLYTASSGVRYDRFDYDLHGPLWPKGEFDVTVRLRADGRNTVVEQQFEVEDGGRNRVRLSFIPKTTTENGAFFPEPYSILAGEVTLGVRPPWDAFFDYGPDSIALNSGDDRQAYFSVVPDPLPVGTGCAKGRAPSDAEALARTIRSDPDLKATVPVAADVGEIEALRMDVSAATKASVCDDWGTPLVVSGARLRAGPGLQRGDKMRLYLLDLPKGSSARTLAIAFVAPEASFDSVLDEAPVILDSFEFHTP